jgi:hypothetical protein
MKPGLFMVLVSLLAGGCASGPVESLVGNYYAPQLCSLSKDYDLTLAKDGTYRMITTLPEGVGPDLGESVRAGFEEVGRWSFDGAGVKLKPENGKTTTFLKLSTKDGVFVLSDAKMFGPGFTKQEPNQALVPTVTSVTPAADAPVAPAAPAAHL